MTHCSSWVMTMSWKLDWAWRDSMRAFRASARAVELAASRLVVGSSRAKIPQCRQKVSASASRIIRQASTCTLCVYIWPLDLHDCKYPGLRLAGHVSSIPESQVIISNS